MIEYADRFFWNQISNEWYVFWPLGRHMMHYVEGTGELEMIPLIVINTGEFEEYLHNVRLELLHENPVPESLIELQTFLNDMKMEECHKSNDTEGYESYGNRIWKHAKGWSLSVN